MKKSDWLIYISFILIIAAMLIFAVYIYTNNVNECTSDPIKFGVETIRYKYDADLVFGEITFYKDGQSQYWQFGDDRPLLIE